MTSVPVSVRPLTQFLVFLTVKVIRWSFEVLMR